MSRLLQSRLLSCLSETIQYNIDFFRACGQVCGQSWGLEACKLPQVSSARNSKKESQLCRELQGACCYPCNCLYVQHMQLVSAKRCPWTLRTNFARTVSQMRSLIGLVHFSTRVLSHRQHISLCQMIVTSSSLPASVYEPKLHQGVRLQCKQHVGQLPPGKKE